MSFSWDEISLKHKNLMILWNLHNFLLDFQSNNNLKLTHNPVLDDEERYMLSRLHSTIKKVTEELDAYHLDSPPELIEQLYMDLSRVYIQLIREKSVIGTEQEKEAILYTIYHTMLEIIKMFSIVCPFITEKIYHDLKSNAVFGLEKMSVHDYDWPTHDEKMIDEDMEMSMDHIHDVMQSILSCRDKLNLGVRWPLSECIIDTTDKEVIHAVETLRVLIEKQVNVKRITVGKMDVELKVNANMKVLGKEFGKETAKIITLINANERAIAEHVKANKAFNIDGLEITSNHVNIEKICPPDYVMADVKGGSVYLDKKVTPELELEGFAREIVRRIQQLRKDSKLDRKDLIELFIQTGLEIDKFEDMIKEKVGARKVVFQEGEGFNKFDAEATEKIKGKDIKIGFNKV
jgi:isoleucyl-tRNA synthetase